MKKSRLLQHIITVLFLGALSFAWAFYFAHYHATRTICNNGIGGFSTLTLTESQTGLIGICPAHMKQDISRGAYASHIVACYDHERTQTYICNMAHREMDLMCPITYPMYDIQILTATTGLKKNLTRESVGCFVLWFKTP